jgi:uncharacterized integral membrane protein
MGGLIIPTQLNSLEYLDNNGLLPPELVESFENKVLAWPQMRDSEIDDRTQSDKVVKAIALTQVSWFVAQLIGRRVNGLAITTLEIFTLSNVFCTTVTYLAWWSKPNGIRTPILLEVIQPDRVVPIRHVGMDNYLDLASPKVLLASLLVNLIFASLHFIGWHSAFPSQAERMLWRICCVGVVLFSIILSVFIALNSDRRDKLPLRDPSKYPVFNRILTWNALLNDSVKVVMLGLYGVFRLYLMIEMIVGLREASTDAYKMVEWTQYFPSFG